MPLVNMRFARPMAKAPSVPGGERLDAQDAVVNRAIGIALDTSDRVVVVDREDHAALRMAVEAHCPYFFFSIANLHFPLYWTPLRA